MYITSVAVGTEIVINGIPVKICEATSKFVKFGIEAPPGCNVVADPQPEKRRIVLRVESQQEKPCSP